MKHPLRIWCCLLIGVLSGSGCSSLALTPNATPPDIVGTWQFKNTDLGPLTLTFHSDRQFQVDYNADGHKDIWGHYDLFLDRIKFTDDRPREITLCYESGIYAYQINGNELTFDLYADQCLPRKGVLSERFIRGY